MTKRWAWAGAKAIGEMHVAAGTPCEDAVACDVVPVGRTGETLIAALADGAGSAEHARVGSALAVSYFCETVRLSLEEDPDRRPDADLVRHAVGTARQSLAIYAARHGRDLRSYASTLVVAVLDGKGGTIAQIGDGAAVIAPRGNPSDWCVPIWPDHGEYINTTSFLTDEDWLPKLRVASIDAPPARLSLFSDGLERLVLDFARREPHAPFFNSVFRDLEQIRWQHGESRWTSDAIGRLLGSHRVARRTDDDRTLFIASLREV